MTAPPTAISTSRVIKGSLWTFAGQIAPLAVSLVTTPINIRLLGAETYGVLVLFVVIPQYLYFADFGMSLASTKFGAAAFSEGDRDKEARVVRTAAVIAAALSIPVAAILAFFSTETAQLFNVPEHLLGEAGLALKLVAATLPLTLLGIIVNSPLLARLRMDLHTAIASGTRIAGMIGIPIALYLGYGLVGAAAVLLMAALANLLGQMIGSAKVLPQFAGLSLDRASLSPLFRFGAAMCIAAVAAMALVNLEKGALSALSSVTQLAYYSVAFSLSAVLTFAAGAMQQSLIPVFSQLQEQERSDERDRIFSSSIRVMLLMMLPVLAAAGIFAETGITIFAGPDFGREGTLPFQILLVGVVFMIITHTPAAAIIASGRTALFAKLYWIELPLYAVLVWFLVGRYGAIGAATAWTTRAVIDSILQYKLANRFAGVAYVGRSGGWIAAAGAIAVLPLAAFIYFDLGLAAGAALSVAGTAVYIWFVWAFVLAPNETAFVARIIRGPLGVLD